MTVARAPGRPPTPTRACGPSTRPTPPTTSAAATWLRRSSVGSVTAACSAGSCWWSGARGPGSRAWSVPGSCLGVRRGQVAGSGEWFITTMFPGSSPFQALAESLRRVTVTESAGLADRLAEDPGAIDRVLRDLVPEDGQLLLVIDQFEELFTSATDRDRRAFLDGVVEALSAPDSRLRLVATLRADFYDRPLGVQGFGSLVNDATVTIAAMPPAELEAAIVEPAERVGRQVERALVAEFMSAVADEPAALPALQFTLYELAASCPDSPHAGGVPRARRGGRRHRLTGRVAVPLPGRRRTDRGPAALRAPRGRRRRRRAHPASGRPDRADRRPGRSVGPDRDRGLGERPAPQPGSPSPDPGAHRRDRPRSPAARMAPLAGLDRGGPRRLDGARPPAGSVGQLGRPRPRPRGAVPGCPAPGGAGRG